MGKMILSESGRTVYKSRTTNSRETSLPGKKHASRNLLLQIELFGKKCSMARILFVFFEERVIGRPDLIFNVKVVPEIQSVPRYQGG
jgi:hypothetical protein